MVDERCGLVFVSGQIAWDVNGRVQGHGYGEQMALALENLSLALAAAGCAVADVLSVRGQPAEHVPVVGPPLATFFGATRPALAGLGVASLATPDPLIEIDALTRVPAGVARGLPRGPLQLAVSFSGTLSDALSDIAEMRRTPEAGGGVSAPARCRRWASGNS
jgi:enamine deaminase RidA (YjgF/YER057c/UK114 family)